ncbi:MAG TPA: ribosome small subunit-dependent GTPase A [Elusimicrobiota bacterium]|nr:ribosome small subunit-dependent GTPase A [Elusimicrobiota bacterium]
MDLKKFGWTEESFPPPPQDKPYCAPARVVEEQKGGYYVVAATGELWAEVAGRLFYEASSRLHLPVVGDWVWIHPALPDTLSLIHGILPRKNGLSRLGMGRDAATGEEQPLAANVDTMLIVTSLNKEFNPSRLERYGTLAGQNGIRPVVILNKADICDDPRPYVTAAREALPGAAVLTVSAATGLGMETLSELLTPGSTGVLLGSSGVGKSTLINRLLQEAVQDTMEIRADDHRGRHATTTRSLFRLPSGALLIDSPGLREVGLPQTGQGLPSTFSDIEQLSANCRYRNCSHAREPGCAVQEARRLGNLSERRYLNYLKLLKERAFIKRKTDKGAAREHKKYEKRISRLIKEYFKQGRPG